MLNKKRERLEVIRDILVAVRDSREIKPTRLLYASNLSPQMFRDYVDELIKKGFLSVNLLDNSKKTIKISKKGNDFLEEYKVIEKFVGNFGL